MLLKDSEIGILQDKKIIVFVTMSNFTILSELICVLPPI